MGIENAYMDEFVLEWHFVSWYGCPDDASGLSYAAAMC